MLTSTPATGRVERSGIMKTSNTDARSALTRLADELEHADGADDDDFDGDLDYALPEARFDDDRDHLV